MKEEHKSPNVYTRNKGELEVIDGFEFHRGVKDIYMGQAQDKKGLVYDVYTDECGLDNCICGARAELPED